MNSVIQTISIEFKQNLIFSSALNIQSSQIDVLIKFFIKSTDHFFLKELLSINHFTLNLEKVLHLNHFKVFLTFL